jgi:hypothetical protein
LNIEVVAEGVRQRHSWISSLSRVAQRSKAFISAPLCPLKGSLAKATRALNSPRSRDLREGWGSNCLPAPDADDLSAVERLSHVPLLYNWLPWIRRKSRNQFGNAPRAVTVRLS